MHVDPKHIAEVIKKCVFQKKYRWTVVKVVVTYAFFNYLLTQCSTRTRVGQGISILSSRIG